MKMMTLQRGVLSTIAVLASGAMLMAQGPGGAKGKGGPPRPVLSVTSPAWADGGEVPMKNAGRGENKSPEFEFHWSLGNNPTEAPEGLQTYAIVFHDIENSSNKTTVDTLHWSAFNIPGTTKTLPEGLGSGDLPDGTRNGPGIAAGRGAPAYFGPGAGPGPFHHYVFEFYALDTKLDLPANTTRDALMRQWTATL
jgi:phosphatidylethanolamine-binding protein (PEBP) family uncharacterized protein